MATTVYPQGNSGSFVVPDGQKVAVFSNDSISLWKLAGYPNHPSQWVPVTTTAAGDTYVSAAVTGDTTMRIDTRAAPAYYTTGASPSVSAPQTDITAADGTFDIAGLDAAQGGYVKVKGGTSSTAGNAGGAGSVVGGQPGATGIGGAANLTGGIGGATSGSGGAANVTGGAGTNGNANGGSAILKGGAKNGSGFDGMVIERSVKLVNQGAATAKTTSATLTAAEVLAGIITVNQGGGAASALQLPTGQAMDNAMPDVAVNDAFDFSVINISTTDAEDASLTTNTDWTLVGSMNVPAFSTSTNASLNSSARFRAQRTAAHVWTLFRLC